MEYIIIGSEVGDKVKAAARSVNKRGGYRRSDSDFKILVTVSLLMMAASLWPGLLGWMMLAGAFAVGAWAFVLGWQVLFVLPEKNKLCLTSDAEIIGLDHDWHTYVDSLPADQRHGEDRRRFIAVRRLNDTEAGASRTEEILHLRHSLQERTGKRS